MGFDPSDIKTTDPVKPSKKSSGFSAAHIAPGAGNNDAFLGGESTNAFKFDEFGFQPKTNADNYKLRAQAQGWGEQLVKTIGNTLVNIPLGIMEGVGYLGELFDNSHDYDNELISTMKNWSNPFGEVYRENPGEVFDLGDPAWWFNNVGQLVESAAEFALPGAYIGKGLSMLGKAGSTLAAGTKIAGAVEKVTGLAARGGTAMSLAYMEGAMSGNQVYKEIYNQQYERLKNKGMGPLEAEETARKLASQGAASTVRINTLVNTAMNFVSLEPFFKNSETKIRNWINTEGKIMAGESKPAWKARLAQAAESNPELKKILAKPSRFMYIPGMVSEGVEEVNTQYAEETGREVGGIRAKNDLSILEDYFEKVGNQEGLLNFVLGAVGGMAQTAILESVPIHQIAKIGADGKPLLKPGTDETAYQARRVSARTRDWNQKTQYFNNIKEAITADIDWYSKKNEDLEKAVAANKPLEAQKIRNEILSAHNLHAVMLGNASNWIQEYEDIGAIDNSKDLGEPVAKQIEQITAQIEQGKAEGVDTAEAEQQLTALQAQYNKVKGKTAAMLKGYAYDKNDHEYKKRARQAADDVKWMDGLHAELRTKYLDETNPDSEELINHIFSRAVTQHVTKRLLDEETQRLDRDEMLFGSIQKHQSTIEVAKKLSASLANDIDNLRSATDLKAIKKLLGKYKISVPGDGQIQQAVDELVDVLNRRNKANKEAAEQATDQLYDTSGFNAWKEMNPGKSFDDFLKFTGDTSPVDDDFVSRKVELQKAQIEYATGETALAEVKSQRGKQAFLKAAQKDKAEWTRKEEQKRVRDTAAILERKFGKEVAAKLNRASIEREMAEIKKQADELKEKRATLAAQLSSLNGQIAEMGKTSFFKGLASKVGDVFTANDLKDTRDNVQAQVEQIDRALTRLEARTVELEAKLEVALGQETKVKDITIDKLKDDDPASNPTVDPPGGPAATTKVEAGSVGVGGETYLVDSMLVEKINPDGENTALTERQEGSIEKAVQMAIDAGQTAEQIAGTLNALGYAFKNPLGMQAAQQTLINYIKNRINGTDTRNINEFAKNTKAVEQSIKEQPKSPLVISATSYAELTTKVPGEVLDALDNIEMVQKMRMEAGQGYSYDAAMAGLQPAIKDQLISVDTAHSAIILQKEYLTSLTAVKGEPEQISQPIELSLGVAEPAVTSAFVSSEVQAIEDRRRLTISMLTPAPTEPILIDNAGNLYRRMNLGNGYVLNKFDSSFEGYEGSFDGTSVSTRKVTDSELAQIHTRVNAKFDVELKVISIAPSVTTPAATVKPPEAIHQTPEIKLDAPQRTLHDLLTDENVIVYNGAKYIVRVIPQGIILTTDGETMAPDTPLIPSKNLWQYKDVENQLDYMLYQNGYKTTAQTMPVDQNDLEKMSIPIIPVISGNINIEAAIQDELEEHVGAKSKTAGKVNSATIQYTEIAPGDEVWDEVNKKMVKMTRHMFIPMYDKLDEKANHNILKPGFIQENDELEFRVDPDFVGEVNYDKMLVTDDFGKVVKRPDSFMDHADASGKIIMNEETDGYYNVPIAIYHKRSGEKIGYLPRTDWVTAKHGNALNYRNLRNVIRDAMGNIITDNNVAEQKVKLLKMRKKIAEAYNAGNTQVFTSAVTGINPGHIFYNTEVNLDSENYKYKNQQTKNVIPDTSVTFAMVNNGTVFVGHATAFSGKANFTEDSVRKRFGSSTNQPAVLLPMPNGGMSLSPIETVELSSRTADTFTIARAIEAYIAFHEKKMTPFHEALIEKIRETTSHGGTSRELDITDEKDLELFINQYFTYTQHFKDYHTRADRPVTEGEKKEPRFKLDIANRGAGKYSLIKIGTTFSGIPPMKASINADGTLNEDFENALIEGLGTHRKAITFTNGDLRGLNHRGEFHSLTVTKRKDKDGKWVIATKKHANYNEYVKTFTTSHVYGKHQIGRDGKPDASGNGRYVYGANPVIEFDMEAVIGAQVVRNATAAELADIAELELSGDPFADTGLEVFGDAFENDAVVNYAGTIEGAVEASIENLTKLQSNTPAEKRNSKSPEQVQNEMYSSGITQIAPDFNPFLKC